MFFSVKLVIAACLVLVAGCVANRPSQRFDLPVTTQPSAAPIAVDQISGQLAAKLTALIDARLAVQGIGYTSEFGIGAAMCVFGTILMQNVTLIVMLVMSHRREMARIAAGKS